MMASSSKRAKLGLSGPLDPLDRTPFCSTSREPSSFGLHNIVGLKQVNSFDIGLAAYSSMESMLGPQDLRGLKI